MKIVILITNNFLGEWMNLIPNITNTQSIDVYVLENENENLFRKFLYKIDARFFGIARSTKKESIILNTIDSNAQTIQKRLDEYDIIINFTKNRFHIQKRPNIITFTIEGKNNIEEAIFYHTICEYEKVTLSLLNNDRSYRSSVRLDPFSFSRNTDVILHNFLSLLKRCFDDKINRKEEEFFFLNQKFKSISITQYCRFYNRYLKKTIEYLFYNEQWILGYDFANEYNIGVDFKTTKKIIPPKDRFWADPVVVFENGKYYVFIEELIYKNKIAHLSVFEITEDGYSTKPEKILEKPYHLSYPFVFKYEEKYYMIPETAKGGNIQLYESVVFPYEWALKKVLINNIKASDTTLLQYNEKWWLFTSVKEYELGMYDNNLCIYYSDDLLTGEWVSHKGNPVKNDVSNSRQGGAFFENESNIYRVSQNCSVRYGYGFMVNKIRTLTEDLYEEQLEYSFIPNDNKIKGIHTYNHLENNFKMFDILIKKRKF